MQKRRITLEYYICLLLFRQMHGEFVTRWRLKKNKPSNLKAKLGNQSFGDQMCLDFSSHCCVLKITYSK